MAFREVRVVFLCPGITVAKIIPPKKPNAASRRRVPARRPGQAVGGLDRLPGVSPLR